MIAIRNSCPRGACSCGYTATTNKGRLAQTYPLSQLTPKQVQKMKTAELLSILRTHKISQDNKGRLVGINTLLIPYLCRKTEESIIKTLGEDIKELRQYHLDLLPAGGPDDIPPSLSEISHPGVPLNFDDVI